MKMSEARDRALLELSVVVPLFNEEDNVRPLYDELTDALADVAESYELLLIDDGSTDRTVERLRSICAADPRVRVLRFRRNYGQTAAIQAGFDAARGAVVVTLDGDLQNDPRDIGAMLAELEAGFDVVSGWRRDRKDVWLTRKLPSVVANWLIGRLTGVRIHDNGCTLKAYRREVVKRARLYSEMHRFLAPMLSLSGCRYREVVVHHRARRFGQSKYGLGRIWKVFLDLLTVKMLLRFATHPAAWFAILGFPFAVAGVLVTALSAYLYLAPASGDFEIVVPSIAVLLVFAAAHLVLFGMFAELVVRTGDYRETEPIVTRVETRANARTGVREETL